MMNENIKVIEMCTCICAPECPGVLLLRLYFTFLLCAIVVHGFCKNAYENLKLNNWYYTCIDDLARRNKKKNKKLKTDNSNNEFMDIKRIGTDSSSVLQNRGDFGFVCTQYTTQSTRSWQKRTDYLFSSS